MIYKTIGASTPAFIWNTAESLELSVNVFLSDYTGLQSEVTKDSLEKTLKKSKTVFEEEYGKHFTEPCLMTITTGDEKSCRVWVDISELVPCHDLFDPEKDFEFYKED